MDLSARRELNNGFGDSLSRAFELAATPALFAGFGYLIDKVFGIVPVFTIALLLLAAFGEIVLWWYRYDHKMSQLEDELVAKRSASATALSAETAEPAEQPAPLATARKLADAKLPSGVTLDTDGGSER